MTTNPDRIRNQQLAEYLETSEPELSNGAEKALFKLQEAVFQMCENMSPDDYELLPFNPEDWMMDINDFIKSYYK